MPGGAKDKRERGPRSLGARALARYGLEIRDKSAGLYACTTCRRTWTVDAPARGESRPAGWWRCATGCNADGPKDQPASEQPPEHPADTMPPAGMSRMMQGSGE